MILLCNVKLFVVVHDPRFRAALPEVALGSCIVHRRYCLVCTYWLDTVQLYVRCTRRTAVHTAAMVYSCTVCTVRARAGPPKAYLQLVGRPSCTMRGVAARTQPTGALWAGLSFMPLMSSTLSLAPGLLSPRKLAAIWSSGTADPTSS